MTVPLTGQACCAQGTQGLPRSQATTSAPTPAPVWHTPIHREDIVHLATQRVTQEVLATGYCWCRCCMGLSTLTVRETRASATRIDNYDDSPICQRHEGRVKIL